MRIPKYNLWYKIRLGKITQKVKIITNIKSSQFSAFEKQYNAFVNQTSTFAHQSSAFARQINAFADFCNTFDNLNNTFTPCIRAYI